VWTEVTQVAKNLNFWYKFSPNGHIHLKRSFCQIWGGQGVPGPQPHAKFYRYGLINVGLWPKKIANNGNVWYKFVPKGYILLSDCYKILHGRESPEPHPAAK